MNTNSSKSQEIGGVVGALVLIIIVAGLGYYLYSSTIAQVPIPQVAASSYSTDVITKDLQQSGVFDKTVFLQPVPDSNYQNTHYQPGEIGKSDISKPE